MSQPREAIADLVHLYAERIDAGDFAGVGALFADAAILGPDGTPVARGADEARRLYERTTRRYEDGTPRTKHVTSNLIVEVDGGGEEARARSYFTVFQAVPGALALQPIVAGRYHDVFARSGDTWRFRERRMFVDLVGELGRHLLVTLGG